VARFHHAGGFRPGAAIIVSQYLNQTFVDEPRRGTLKSREERRATHPIKILDFL
jgi:hypothetical protein